MTLDIALRRLNYAKYESFFFEAVVYTVCSSKTRQNVTFWTILTPLNSLVFGVREPKSVQKLSKFAEVGQKNNFLRLKCIFAPFLRLKGAIGSLFQAFSAENSENFDFSTKIQKP